MYKKIYPREDNWKIIPLISGLANLIRITGHVYFVIYWGEFLKVVSIILLSSITKYICLEINPKRFIMSGKDKKHFKKITRHFGLSKIWITYQVFHISSSWRTKSFSLRAKFQTKTSIFFWISFAPEDELNQTFACTDSSLNWFAFKFVVLN